MTVEHGCLSSHTLELWPRRFPKVTVWNWLWKEIAISSVTSFFAYSPFTPYLYVYWQTRSYLKLTILGGLSTFNRFAFIIFLNIAIVPLVPSLRVKSFLMSKVYVFQGSWSSERTKCCYGYKHIFLLKCIHTKLIFILWSPAVFNEKMLW